MNSQSNSKMCNAWIFLNEDEPVVDGQKVPYTNPASSYQRLINKRIYASVDMLYLCFAVTVPTSASTIPVGDGSSYTLQMGQGSHPEGAPPPPQYSNQDYMNFIIRDARKVNPALKIGMTLLWGNADTINQIFSNDQVSEQQNAANFAANLVAYLKHYDLDGFDIDWEYPISSATSASRMSALLDAVGAAFQAETSKKYYLTLAPVTNQHLESAAVNPNVDFLSLQLYGGTYKGAYTDIGINEDLLAYGAKFESNYQTAQQAYDGYQTGGYTVATQWRLNSGNYEYEQDQQVELYKLIHGGG